MNFIHDLINEINRMVMKAQIPSKTMKELKMAQHFKVKKDQDLPHSIDDRTAKIALAVQIMKNGAGKN